MIKISKDIIVMKVRNTPAFQERQTVAVYNRDLE